MRFLERCVEETWSADVVEEAVETLRNGGILVHPSSTLYGLGAAVRPELDAELARLKGRGAERSFVRLAPDALTVARRLPPGAWDERAECLAAAFWPGPVTLVLPDGSPRGLAVRVDGHPLVRAVLSRWGELMTSTSVNRSGEPPARTPAEVRRGLERMPETTRPVRFLNAGPVGDGKPSTIVSLCGPAPEVVREGTVPADRILRCLGAA